MTILYILLIVALIATAGVLAVGIAGFLQGGAFNERYGNKLMRARVGLQFTCIVLLAIILMWSR